MKFHSNELKESSNKFPQKMKSYYTIRQVTIQLGKFKRIKIVPKKESSEDFKKFEGIWKIIE